MDKGQARTRRQRLAAAQKDLAAMLQAANEFERANSRDLSKYADIMAKYQAVLDRKDKELPATDERQTIQDIVKSASDKVAYYTPGPEGNREHDRIRPGSRRRARPR